MLILPLDLTAQAPDRLGTSAAILIYRALIPQARIRANQFRMAPIRQRNWNSGGERAAVY